MLAEDVNTLDGLISFITKHFVYIHKLIKANVYTVKFSYCMTQSHHIYVYLNHNIYIYAHVDILMITL